MFLGWVPHLYRWLCLCGVPKIATGDECSILQTSNKARLAPEVEYKQLSMRTQSVLYSIVQLQFFNEISN